MCDFEQVISLFPCFSGTDVEGVILQSATPKMVSMVEDDLFVLNVNCSSFDEGTCDDFVASDNCSSVCKSEYSAEKLSAQVEKSGRLTSMSRSRGSGYDSAHELPVWTLRQPNRLSHGSGYYSAEELPAWVLKRSSHVITRSRSHGSICDFVEESSARMPRQSNHLFTCSISRGSRSDFAEEFPAQMQTRSLYLFTGSRSHSSESDSADELPAQMLRRPGLLFSKSRSYGSGYDSAEELPACMLRERSCLFARSTCCGPGYYSVEDLFYQRPSQFTHTRYRFRSVDQARRLDRKL
jgi:hypothetical protein